MAAYFQVLPLTELWCHFLSGRAPWNSEIEVSSSLERLGFDFVLALISSKIPANHGLQLSLSFQAMFLEQLQNLEKESQAISELGRLVNEVKAC